PVFYVQYAHARICSIFRQAEEQQIALKDIANVNLALLNTEAEFDLLLKMAELPEETAIAAAQYAPHRLIRYIYELASMFHSYYKAERIITEDEELTQARLALAACLRTVFRNILSIIGVSAPERM